MSKSKESTKKKPRKWIGKMQGIDADIMDLAEQAAIIHDSSLKFLSSLHAYIKDLHISGNKHPMSKAADAVRAYKTGMRNPSNVFDEASSEFEAWYTLMGTTGAAMSSTSLAKLQSFKDMDCKEVDSEMKLLKKMLKDMNSKAKKTDKNDNAKVMAEAAAETFKKKSAECREMLKKFNANGTSVINMVSVDMVKCFEQYCTTAYGKNKMPERTKRTATSIKTKKPKIEEKTDEKEDEKDDDDEDS